MLEIRRLPDSREVSTVEYFFRSSEYEADWLCVFDRSPKLFFKVIRLKDEETANVGRLSIDGFYFIQCLSGQAELLGTDFSLKQGDFLHYQCKAVGPDLRMRSLFSQEAKISILMVNQLPGIWSKQARQLSPKNIREVPYDPRPGGILLKSLFVGSVLEDLIGYEYVEMPARSVINPHTHPDSDAFVYVAKGEGAFTVGDTRILVQRGCHGNIPKGCKHAVEAGAEGLDFISVQVPPIGSDEGYIFYTDNEVRTEIRLV